MEVCVCVCVCVCEVDGGGGGEGALSQTCSMSRAIFRHVQPSVEPVPALSQLDQLLPVGSRVQGGPC